MTVGCWDIAFAGEVLERVGARRVVVAGAAEGIWSALTHGATVGAGRGPIRLEAIEWFERRVEGGARALFDRVHEGSFDEVLRGMEDAPDLVVLGEGLFRWPKASAMSAIRAAIESAAYALVLVPLGISGGGGPHEARATTWEVSDFFTLPVVLTRVSRDDRGRAYGCFVLSERDPAGLAPRDADGATSSEGESARADTFGTAPEATPELDAILDRLSEQAFELAYIKRSGSYRALRRVRDMGLGRLARPASTRDVTIRALGEKGASSQGSEVWILGVRADRRERHVPWDFVNRRGSVTEKADARAPYGKCFVVMKGSARFVAGADPEVTLLMHPWSGRVEVGFAGRTEVIDLYHPTGAVATVYPARTPMVPSGPVATMAARRGASRGSSRFSPGQEAFLARYKAAAGDVVAVHCPRWLGVSSSTRNLFAHGLPVPETPAEEPYYLSDYDLARYARVIAEASPRVVVFSGGDEAHLRLMELVRALCPSTSFRLLWHGNYVQWSDDYAWKTLNAWIDAGRAGRVHTLGTVKKGMEQVLAAMGVRSRFVMNYVPLPEGGIPAPAGIPGSDRHLGLWMSGTLWKTPNVMLAACALMPSVVVHTAGLDDRAGEIARALGVRVRERRGGTIPHEELMGAMRGTHLTLYATFTECCPMIPLESLAQGVPAIVGPTSHLLEDDAYLFERLVVPFPDRADVIARFAERAIAEREEIVRRYAAYVPGYNARARASVEAFLA